MKATINEQVPNFELPATGERFISLKDLAGKKIVIYFYPKDHTPGCTSESKDFRDSYQAFVNLNTIILGVSRDSVKTHESFKAKHGFQFDLISDKDEVLCGIFDVIKLKKLYGKEYMGIDRSTFLIDENGVLLNEWRTVKVNGHVAEVLKTIQSLS